MNYPSLLVIFVLGCFNLVCGGTISNKAQVIVVEIKIVCDQIYEEQNILYSLCNDLNSSKLLFKNGTLDQNIIHDILKSKPMNVNMKILSYTDASRLVNNVVYSNNTTKNIRFIGYFANDNKIIYYTSTVLDKDQIPKMKDTSGNIYRTEGIDTLKLGDLTTDSISNTFSMKSQTESKILSPILIRRQFLREKLLSKSHNLDTTKQDSTQTFVSSYAPNRLTIYASTNLPDLRGFSVGIWVFIIITMSLATIITTIILCQRFCDVKILTFRMLPSIAGDKIERIYRKG